MREQYKKFRKFAANMKEKKSVDQESEQKIGNGTKIGHKNVDCPSKNLFKIFFSRMPMFRLQYRK